MAKIALIGTFTKRYEQSVKCLEAVMASTRVPDEIWIMCETEEDAANARKVLKHNVLVRRTPKADGKYTIIPYSDKINFVLDHTKADYICYLDNGSIPHRQKYEIMAKALDDHPEWFAVYCSQHRTGFQDLKHIAAGPIEDPYCIINFTQVMHRPTHVRWTLDMQNATPHDIADAMFFRDLNCTFYPVPTEKILDIHEMESSAAAGL